MKSYYYNLDGLRGVAAFSVLFLHTTHYGLGYLSVDLFFILSGFVLALQYEDRLRSGMPGYIFLLRRARRLLPIFWLGVAVCILCAVFLRHDTELVRQYAIRTLLFIPDFRPLSTEYPLDPNAWSLLIEWLLCFAFATGVYRCKTGILMLTITTGWVIMICLGLILFHKWDVGYLTFLLPVGIFCRGLPAFCLGIIISRYRRSDVLLRLPEVSPTLLLFLWLGLLSVPYTSPWYEAGVVILCAPILMLLLIRSEPRAPKWCRLAGRLSYPLYISHRGIVMTTQHYIKHMDIFWGILTIVASLLVAAIIMKLNDIIQRHLADIPLRLPQVLRGH